MLRIGYVPLSSLPHDAPPRQFAARAATSSPDLEAIVERLRVFKHALRRRILDPGLA